jgi:hypothetical protein
MLEGVVVVRRDQFAGILRGVWQSVRQSLGFEGFVVAVIIVVRRGYEAGWGLAGGAVAVAV